MQTSCYKTFVKYKNGGGTLGVLASVTISVSQNPRYSSKKPKYGLNW